MFHSGIGTNAGGRGGGGNSIRGLGLDSGELNGDQIIQWTGLMLAKELRRRYYRGKGGVEEEEVVETVAAVMMHFKHLERCVGRKSKTVH